jgi:ATP-dependent DNA ligase
MHVRDPPGRLVRQVPVQLYLFDLLHHEGQSLLPVPHTGRRARLADVLAASLANALERVVGKLTCHPGRI